MENRYIGSGQTAVVIASFGVLWCLCMAAYGSCGDMLISCTASVLALGIIAIPLVMLCGKNDLSVTDELSKSLGVFGRIVSGVYVLYFLSTASRILGSYGSFVSERYFREGGEVLCIALLGIVCVYVAHTGAGTVCRMSTVLLFLFGVTLAMWIIMGVKDISLEGIVGSSRMVMPLTFESATGGLFTIGGAALAGCCIICGENGKRMRTGIYGGLAALLGASAAVIFLTCSTLGDYISASEYPLLDSVVYVSRKMSFRPDGIYFLLWTVIAIAAVSFLCSCAGAAARTMFPRIKGEGAYAAAISAAAAALCSWVDTDICGYLFDMPLMPLILAGLIPLVLLIVKGGAKSG